MTVTCNTGSQGRRAKTLSRALDADSEAAPVGRAAGERGRRSIAELGERLQRLRFVRTLLPAIERLLHPRARARSVRAREDAGPSHKRTTPAHLTAQRDLEIGFERAGD